MSVSVLSALFDLVFHRAHSASRGVCGRRRIMGWGLVVLAVVCGFATARAEEETARAERFDNLIESLNAGSAQRSKTIETIYTELRGPHGRELQQLLRETLSRGNSLIVQGAIEALALYGDPDDIGAMEILLATTPKLEVKNLAIRLLPAYSLTGSERARINYINYAAGYQRIAGPDVLTPLRRPPLTRRGRLDQARERLQNRVLRILAGQFDPVGAALPYVGDLLYGAAARETVVHYVGKALGNDPGRWPMIWTAQGRDVEFLVPGEVEEIRLSVLASLSDMGAEGTPEILAAFEPLLETGGDVLRQAAFDVMAVMCRIGFAMYAPLENMQFTAEDAVEAENWRHLRFASIRRLAVFASDQAAAALPQSGDEAVFSAVAGCMSSALTYPAGFPDPDGLLAAARQRGLAELERLLLMPDLSREKRSALAMALGHIGSEGAVAAIASILSSPYSSPEFGPDGLRMAEAAVEGLKLAATGDQDGRDAARNVLLSLFADRRQYAPLRAGTPPVQLAHLVLWRLQRLARSTDTSFDAEAWRERLGW